MSVNIKTASGLQKLSSNVTKNTIADALGYTPANPDSVNADLRAHTTDTDIHVSLAEKDKFLDYKQLNNLPNIVDDESGEFSILDKNGNTALQVDSTGVTNVASLTVNGQDVESFMNSSSATSTTHNTDEVRHITAEERAYWNNKTQIEDDSNSVLVVDKDGNAAFEIDSAGSTNVAKLTIEGKDVLETISDAADAVTSELNTHKNAENDGDGLIHIQAGERARWNDTSKMEGNLQLNDDGADFIISDKTGEVAFQVVADGTTQVANLEINGVNVANRIGDVESDAAANLSAHNTSKLEAGDSRHIQEGERAFWNDKENLQGNIKLQDDGDQFIISDKNNDVAFQVNSAGTTQVADLEIGGVNVVNRINTVEGNAAANLRVTDGKVDTLIGTDTGKSVRNIANEELCAQLLTGKADADFKTLEQMATWLEDHPEDVAAMNLQISENSNAILVHDSSETESDGPRHVQQGERTKWNDKSWHSLTDKPNIVNNDESKELQVIDASGNVALMVDATGVTNVASLAINGVDVTTRMDGIEADASTNLSNHTDRTDNPHCVTKAQVGLGNVDNTSDVNKPISIAQEAAHAELQRQIDENSAQITNIINGTTDGEDVFTVEHAKYADSWTSSMTLTLGGDVTGTSSFDGSSDITIDVAVKDNSHNHQISATAEDDDIVILEGTSQTNGVKYKASHAESTVEAGTYKRVTVDKYGHVTSADNPDESWESIEGRPPITTDGNDTEVLVKDSADNVALQLDSEGVLNLAGATVGGIDVAVDFIDYAEIAFDTTELVF